MTLDTTTTQRLADIGFLGVSRGRFAEALAIFETLTVLRPDQEVGPIGSGIALMAMGNPGKAHEVLRAADQTPAVMTFDCLALAKTGNRRAAEDLREDLSEIVPGSPLLALVDASLAEVPGAA